MTPHEVAVAWVDAGFSVVPPRLDGSKAPLGEWKQFMHNRADHQQLGKWYNGTRQTGVGLVCGKISGNLEMLELEGRACDSESLDKIVDACEALGVIEIWNKLCSEYKETTPSGGIHFLYRVFEEDADVPGSTKIARRPATKEELAGNPLDKIKTLSETRGEGGYVIVAPSYGTIHPSGESWDMTSGHPGRVLYISWNDRCRLHEAIRIALDEMPAPVVTEPRPPQQPWGSTEIRPGDAFNEATNWSDLLLPLGWTLVYRKGDKWHWRRPGKNTGVSATTSETTGRLWVFSSSTEFEPEQHYSKFEAYALLEHHGDYAAAASALAREGFGSRPDPFASGVLEVPVADPQQPSPASVEDPLVDDSDVANAQTAQVMPCDAAGMPIYSPAIFKRMQRWNGLSLADAWVALHESALRYVGSDKTWMHFDGKIWNRADKGREQLATQNMVARMVDYADKIPDEDIKKNVQRELKRSTYSSGIASIITNARSRAEIASSWDEFDYQRNLVTLENGVLDLDTFELKPHDHRNMLTKKINAKYDPQAKEGRFTRFMEEVLPDQEVREYLQRVCGYALTGQADERVLVQLYGPSGTGKSQFTKAVFTVMGDFAKRASESAFQSRPTSYKGPSEDLHNLMGSRFAMLPELDEGFRLNVSLIKSLTGGDSMTTRQLYGQEVTWRPEYTIFMITNHLPRVSAGEDAYWNRVKPILFDQVFVDSNGEALQRDCRNLGEKMAAEEPEVILNWLLEGLKSYRERGLDAPQQVAQWRDNYRDDVDSVRQFINEAPDEGRIELGEGKTATVREMHRAYAAWCADNSIPALGMRKFNERMEMNGQLKHRRSGGVTWIGLGVAGWLAENQQPNPHRGRGRWGPGD